MEVVELWEVAVERFDALGEAFDLEVAAILLLAVVVRFDAVVVLLPLAEAVLDLLFEEGDSEAVTFVATIFRPLTLLPVVALGELFVAFSELFAVVAVLADALVVVLVDFVVLGDLVLATDNLF